MKRIQDLPEIPAPDDDDLLVIYDVSGKLVGRASRAQIFGSGGRLRNIEVITADDTWEKPSWLEYAIVEVVGGGGSGGGRIAGGNRCAGGGGGGGYAMAKIDADDLGSTETVTVGAGHAGNSGASGGAGGDTTFGSHLTGGGGQGGTMSSNGGATAGGGKGGTASGGDINIAGETGGQGGSQNFSTEGWIFVSGKGGDSHLGLGADALGFGQTGGGRSAPAGYGGGGGGAAGGPSTAAGGAGRDGIVIVYEFGN